MSISQETVQSFLDRTEFEGYQGFPLRYGLSVPGKDRSKTAAAIFPEHLEGKSVLDIGCCYGYFCHEAKRRGAGRVVGIEMNQRRCAVAQEIARIMENGVEVRLGDATRSRIAEEFDVVLCLNVLHHVADPVATMRTFSCLARATVVVEFYRPTASYQRRIPGRRIGLVGRAREAINRKARVMLTRCLDEHPLIIVGETPYHRTYYFNESAFRNMFLVHNRLFTDIRFAASPYRNRGLAFCTVGSPQGARG